MIPFLSFNELKEKLQATIKLKLHMNIFKNKTIDFNFIMFISIK